MSSKDTNFRISENVTNKKVDIETSDLAPTEKETGWDRVRIMYTRNEYGETSPEAKQIFQGASTCFVTGIILGGMFARPTAKEEFIRKNQDSLHTHQYLAHRRYRDRILMEMLKHGFHWGTKLAFFTGGLMMVTTTLAAYNNKYRIRDFAISGGVCGGIYRWNLGFKGITAGAALGSALGTGCGTLFVALLWATGSTFADLHDWQTDLRRKKKMLLEENLEKGAENLEINAEK